jgi:uncharacterized protein involved in tolerance to divalent cations
VRKNIVRCVEVLKKELSPYTMNARVKVKSECKVKVKVKVRLSAKVEVV